jgi:hypothetical protein
MRRPSNPFARQLSERFGAAFRELGMVSLTVKRPHDSFEAFIRHQEVCLAIVPRFSLRYREARVEGYVALINEEFERLSGCTPFSNESFQTFGAHSANIPMLRLNSFVSESRENEVQDAIASYQQLLMQSPPTIAELSKCLQGGLIFGTSIVHFLHANPTKARRFVDWCLSAGRAGT